MTEEKQKKFLDFCKKEGFDISNIDSAQRKAVLSNEYAVLPAGAGSGKTTVLTYRFLRMLADDEGEKIHSDEILTITFTKAATASMRAKIYLILKKAEKEGLIGEEEIKRFSNGEISTTDSFCSKIVRTDVIRYGLTPSFRIEDDESLKETCESILRKIVDEKIEKESGVEAVLTFFSFDDLLSLFLDYTYNILNIASPVEGDEDEIFLSMKEETLGEIKKANLKHKGELLALLEKFREIFSIYPTLEKDIEHVKNIVTYLETGEEIETKFVGRKTIKENPELYPVYKKMKDKIKEDLSSYTDSLKYEDEKSMELLKGYSSLLYAFQKKMLLHKREKGQLTFHDIMLLSIDILKTNASLRAYYNSRFKRIMVDEFQDNNEENKRLIYLLAAKPDFKSKDRFPLVDDIEINKIFMVGDEKQSIYKFRGADVSVFKNITKDFGEKRVLALSENFRSEKSLINKINRIFDGPIMKRRNEECPDYEAEYTPLLSRRENIESVVSFRYMNASLIKKDRASLLASKSLSEAYEVARIIKEEILGSEKARYMIYDRKTGALREPKAEDIAILLRKTTYQSDFEKALRLFGIPFNVSDNKSLTSESTANDFYSILQYSVYGDDDPLSYASVLRSPFINMDDEDIVKVITNMNEKKERDTDLSDDGRERLGIMDELVEELREKEKRETLSSIIDFLWFDTGYRFSIEAKASNESYREHYDYLFSICTDYDGESKGVVEFLDTIRPTLGNISSFKDINVLSEEKYGVTIQTIHKSKGLEYPIVFISDMAGTSSNDKLTVTELPSGKPLFPYYMDEEGKLKNPLEKVTKKEDNRLENAETKRILYVAATRSMHHLIFTSVFGKRMVDKDGILNRAKENQYNSMLQYFIDGIEFTLENKSSFIETAEFNPVYYYVFREKKEKKSSLRKESWYREERVLPERKERVKIGVTTLIKEDEVMRAEGKTLPRYAADDIIERKRDEEENKVTAFGTLVHLLLEDAIGKKESDTSSFFKDEKKRDVIFESAFMMRDNFLSSSFFKSLSGAEMYPERELLIKDGDNIVEGIIDLLVVNDDKIIIVDYKTDSVINKEKHRRQLGYYKRALSTIYEDKEIETYLFYLRSGEEVRLE